MVNFCMDKKPATLTKPATNDNKDAILKNQTKLTENEAAQVTNKKNIASQTALVESCVAKIKTLTE